MIPRILAALAAAVSVVAPASAGTPPRSPLVARCTPTAAKTAILTTPALKSLRAYLAKGAGGGVDSLICHDLTGDGETDMAATIFSGGTAGDIAWVVLRRSHGKWVLALRQLGLYKVGLFALAGDLVDSQPVYRKNDPNCCPTGGFDHRRFHWSGSRFVVVRRWHDSHFHP